MTTNDTTTQNANPFPVGSKVYVGTDTDPESLQEMAGGVFQGAVAEAQPCDVPGGWLYQIDGTWGNTGKAPTRRQLWAKHLTAGVLIPAQKEDKNRATWNRCCTSLGLKESDYGVTFDYEGTTLRVHSIRTRAKALPIRCEDMNDKTRLFDADAAWLLRQLGRADEIEEVDYEAEYRAAFVKNCKRWNLSPSDIGMTFEQRGETHTVIGAMPRARKHQVIARRESNGKLFRFDPRFIALSKFGAKASS